MIELTAVLCTLAIASILAATFTGRCNRNPGRVTGDGSAAARTGVRGSLPSLRRAPTAVRPEAVAAWADDLARALRHGSTLHAALVHTTPADDAIRRRIASLHHWLGRGATVAEACDEWAEELSNPASASRRRVIRGNDRVELLATISAVLAATASLGGAAAVPLDRLAVAMRQRASDDLERAAQGAQAKMSAKVLTSVPIAVLALLVLTDADVREVIASTSGGTVVALGLALNAVGGVWLRRIAEQGGS